MGSPAASVAVFEFSDFQCPFCGQFVRDTLPTLREKYIDTGLVRLVFRHNPLRIHPRAEAAAEAAECAGEQRQFWGMHDLLFSNPGALEESDLEAYARTLDLELSQFQTCRATVGRMPVQRDVQLATKLRLTGTPMFLVGIVGGHGQATISRIITGARPAEEFERVLDDEVLRAATR